MPLHRYGDKHKSLRKTADTQRMYAAELGIRTRVNGRKCELIRSLRRTLLLNRSELDAERREESGERTDLSLRHTTSPLERDDPSAIYLTCVVPLAGETSASSLSRVSLDLAEPYLISLDPFSHRTMNILIYDLNVRENKAEFIKSVLLHRIYSIYLFYLCSFMLDIFVSKIRTASLNT